MENEKYPKIVIGTDKICQIFISKNVELNFKSAEAIDEFFKDKNVSIIGTNANRINTINDGKFAKQLLMRLTE